MGHKTLKATANEGTGFSYLHSGLLMSELHSLIKVIKNIVA